MLKIRKSKRYLKGRSPVWRRRCAFNFAFDVRVIAQTWQIITLFERDWHLASRRSLGSLPLTPSSARFTTSLEVKGFFRFLLSMESSTSLASSSCLRFGLIRVFCFFVLRFGELKVWELWKSVRVVLLAWRGPPVSCNGLGFCSDLLANTELP